MNKPFAVAFIAAGTLLLAGGICACCRTAGRRACRTEATSAGMVCRPFRNLNVTPG